MLSSDATSERNWRGMSGLTPEQRAFLLGEPGRAHTAKVATVRADGRPHVAPVWFALDGDTIVFNTGRRRSKAVIYGAMRASASRWMTRRRPSVSC